MQESEQTKGRLSTDGDTENQSHNTSESKSNDKPWLWKKGQSGNILGRPKGKSMKEYARQYLERMTDDERDEWMEGLPKELIWKMSEGNPHNTGDITSAGKEITGNVIVFGKMKDEPDSK